MARSVMRPLDPADLSYTEVVPPADLARHVDRFWLRTTRRPSGRVHRVLPDGCVDVIVHADRGAVELVGTMTHAIEVAEAPAELVAVRFKPGTAAAITRCALAELTDQHADLGALGIAGGTLADEVRDANGSQARIAVLVGWLRARLGDAPPPDRVVGRAVALLAGPDTGVRVDEVARTVGVTRQHLARAFRREVGITPKELARIARMQRAAAALGRGRVELARLAAELGYFDQSHLANDARELIGITPATLAEERPLALAHLFEVPFLQSRVRGAP